MKCPKSGPGQLSWYLRSSHLFLNQSINSIVINMLNMMLIKCLDERDTEERSLRSYSDLAIVRKFLTMNREILMSCLRSNCLGLIEGCKTIGLARLRHSAVHTDGNKIYSSVQGKLELGPPRPSLQSTDGFAPATSRNPKLSQLLLARYRYLPFTVLEKF